MIKKKLNLINKNSHVKKGDIIQIIAGEKKGLIGKIQSIFLKKSIVFIEGVDLRTKYKKQSQNAEAIKIELQVPIHISNVMLWDSQNKLRSRIGSKIVEKKKYRYFKKSGNLL
jgi:large subunit ribosomal protein L24